MHATAVRPSVCTIRPTLVSVERHPRRQLAHRIESVSQSGATGAHGVATETFFEETREQSVVKATIVEKYFDAWAGIIIGAQNRHRPGAENRIGYVDLFAGPGRYKDGAVSTPLRVLQKAIEKPEYAERLLTIFNDRDSENVRTLEEEIAKLPGIGKLKNRPVIWNEEVGDKIAKQFAEKSKIPTLAFIDPWGYKGLTLRLVDAFLRDWGCDCIFFFNYARINAGLSNPMVREHMGALFGAEKADALSRVLEPLGPSAREATIVEALGQALKGYGHRFVLPFCFKSDAGTRTKHHLILVTKHFRGYEVMKDIMATASSRREQGVPSFTYSSADSSAQQLLFELNRPLDELRAMLLRDFAGQTVTMRAIYEKHSVDRSYLSRNYKDVLAGMENDGVVKTSGRKSKRGFADDILVTFPPGGS
jgi:three-Cys-motif partner protein